MFFKRDKHDDSGINDMPVAPMPENLSYNPPYNPPYNPVAFERYEKKQDYAPLFVKVEKYRDVLATIAEIRMFVSSMKQLFAVINDLEALRSDAHKIMRATVQRMDKALIEIDTELLRPRGFEIDLPASETEVHQIEDSLTDIQKQMTALKRELEGMR
ncbi:MAG: hypothetical protein HZB67_01870 [Candidatus Aenigmarchaeota archaeon]|nr:hypothetical protein [Candidatus Aenigmarchaeota archaeon]